MKERVAATAFLLGVFLFIGLLGDNAQGSPAYKISELKISVWPEYDDPRVLVMYEGVFSQNTGKPSSVVFYLPPGAEVTEACAMTEKEEHLCQTWEIAEEKGVKKVKYNLPEPRFRMEYYFDGVKGDTRREIVPFLKLAYPVERLAVDVQQPLRSENFQVEPKPANVFGDQQGFNYAHLGFENLAPGKDVSLKIAYTKSDRKPSVKKEVGGEKVPVKEVRKSPYVYLAVGTTIAVIAIGGFATMSRRRRQSAQTPGTPTAATGEAKKADRTARFCTRCGSPLDAGDRFCGQCGKPLR
ncbi:MAG: zinc ribbon domain-containing protein [Candidatus Tectomicrobia bacterium]|uniref:Zinc ribbon domain-containing protein n=1 Tax=Tectimicrobiota bacterium TaxID=2528274 RepID=A0A932M251_UNCTE|nr:zinc ribbon domain-containing protein [Candidatus Tectomicrobia bacterium]